MTSDLNGKVYNIYWNFKLHTNDISKRERAKKEVCQISTVFFNSIPDRQHYQWSSLKK